jgi:parallel beta-helix repeat protein
MVDGYGSVDDFAVVSANFPLDGDFGTIQDAIDAGAHGIYVKTGTYLTPETITVPGGVYILGENLDGVTIDFMSGNWNIVILGFGARIEGLRIVGSGAPLGAFHFNTCTNATVEKCRIDSSVRVATFNAATFCHLKECWGQGASLESVFVDATATDNRIANNRFTSGLHYGIVLEGAFNKVVNNNVSGHAFDGISIWSMMNTIHGNTCNQNENGIYIAKENGDDNSLVGNTCYQNRGYGININSLENAGNVAIGNTLKDNGVADLRFVPGNIVEANNANTIT